ncbi:ZBT18-like protein [Mya arenaria]|uniref:ZBT18-like protein n=1 Tax=Mya arenaria TaxID=6604 RepID=A0ABY7G3B1_MYAAR|nr:ZBT18-like protein [Mya arenaria]
MEHHDGQVTGSTDGLTEEQLSVSQGDTLASEQDHGSTALPAPELLPSEPTSGCGPCEEADLSLAAGRSKSPRMSDARLWLANELGKFCQKFPEAGLSFPEEICSTEGRSRGPQATTMSEEQGQRVTSMSEEEEQQATSISEDHDQKETLMSEGRGQQTTSMSEAYSLMYRDLLKSQIKALEIFIPSWAKKRKWTDLQSQNGPEAGLGQRGVTPPVQMKTEIPDSPLPESPIPKGHHKCSMCNYNSKFKANVTRHEKSVHGMNCDGAMNSTEYLSSTWSEIENRKTSFNLDKNLSIVEQTLQRADSVKTENQSDNDSMMLNMADLQSKMAAGFNENAENYTSNDENSADENYQICNYCQLVFSSLPELKNHIDSEHFGSEDFKCETCGKTFGSMFNLHAHVQSVHNAAKQERCACGKTFQYKIGLSRHSKRCPAAKQQSNGVNIEAGTNSEDHSLQGADDLNIDSRRSNLQGMDSMHGTENSNNDSQLSNSAAGESMQGANDFRNGSQDNELVQVSGNIRAKQGTSLEKSEENLNSEESSMDESEMDKHKSDELILGY